jgi:hypothetical protein
MVFRPKRAQSRRDGAIVAWHEVPGTALPQKSRPVGHGKTRRWPGELFARSPGKAI